MKQFFWLPERCCDFPEYPVGERLLCSNTPALECLICVFPTRITTTISGSRLDEYKNFSFHQMEIHFGDFEVEIHIPQPVERNSIKAEYKNGLLEITLKKATVKEIQIKDKDA
jgi:hypothetical protein